jgi:hypothetical protein
LSLSSPLSVSSSRLPRPAAVVHRIASMSPFPVPVRLAVFDFTSCLFLSICPLSFFLPFFLSSFPPRLASSTRYLRYFTLLACGSYPDTLCIVYHGRAAELTVGGVADAWSRRVADSETEDIGYSGVHLLGTVGHVTEPILPVHAALGRHPSSLI